MHPETAYLVVNLSPLPVWALLMLAPRWRGTRVVAGAALVPLLLTLAYAAAMLKATWPEGAGGATLPAAMRLFDEPWGFVACWAHYVVGDLFAGLWVARDARRHRLPHLPLVPILFATLWMMPLGLGAYLLYRAVLRRTWSLDESLAPLPLGEGQGEGVPQAGPSYSNR